MSTASVSLITDYNSLNNWSCEAGASVYNIHISTRTTNRRDDIPRRMHRQCWRWCQCWTSRRASQWQRRSPCARQDLTRRCRSSTYTMNMLLVANVDMLSAEQFYTHNSMMMLIFGVILWRVKKIDRRRRVSMSINWWVFVICKPHITTKSTNSIASLWTKLLEVSDSSVSTPFACVYFTHASGRIPTKLGICVRLTDAIIERWGVKVSIYGTHAGRPYHSALRYHAVSDKTNLAHCTETQYSNVRHMASHWHLNVHKDTKIKGSRNWHGHGSYYLVCAGDALKGSTRWTPSSSCSAAIDDFASTGKHLERSSTVDLVECLILLVVARIWWRDDVIKQ